MTGTHTELPPKKSVARIYFGGFFRLVPSFVPVIVQARRVLQQWLNELFANRPIQQVVLLSSY
jgi:hypothetical protein